MPRRNRDLACAGLGAAAGLLAVALVARKVRSQPEPPYLQDWRRSLESAYGAAQGGSLAARTRQRYRDLYRGRPRYGHPALRFHLEKNILPGLALYQVLLTVSPTRADALDRTGSLLEQALPQARFVPWIVRLPRPFSIFRWLVRAEMKWFYPRDGWQLRWLQDDDSAIDFHIYRCFYVDVLAAYGAPELTRYFCRLDDVLGEAMAPSITWRRLKTLGRGDEVCDFCFRNPAHPG